MSEVLEPPENFVVFSDLHGRPKLLEALAKNYSEALLISNGDLIGGPDTKCAIDIALDLGIIALFGNHEWFVNLLLNTEDPEIIQDLAVSGHQEYLSNIYASYGVSKHTVGLGNKKAQTLLQKLKDTITDKGHREFFGTLLPYYETDQFLAIHAGLKSNKLWDSVFPHQSQRVEVDNLTWQDKPIQIFDDVEFNLSKRPSLTAGLVKTLITGHYHSDETAEDRSTFSGRRIRLGGPQNPDDPLYVWESWSGKVVPVLAK